MEPDVSFLEAFTASELKKPAKGRQSTKSFDVREYLDHLQLAILAEDNYEDGRKFRLDCVFNEAHKGHAVIFERPNQAPTFHCSHASCADNKWKEFRAKVDPAAGLSIVSMAASGLPQIQTNNRPMRDVTNDAIQALFDYDKPQTIFTRGGSIVTVESSTGGPSRISICSEPRMRGLLARSANHIRVGYSERTKDFTQTDIAPLVETVKDVLSLPTAELPFLHLEGLVETPVMRTDGTILSTSGYDESTKLYYAPAPDFEMPEVPECPTADDVDGARSKLDDILDGFPFVDEASRANALALLVTVVIRPTMLPTSPVFLMDAPAAGTGKSLLADTAARIATGIAGQMQSAPVDRDEWRKLITSNLLDSSPIIVFDNISRPLDSPELAKAATEDIRKDRLLGQTKTVVLRNLSVCIVTGNNIRLGGDMPRRCVSIRLDAACGKPFQRTGFRIPDLKQYVLAHRGELVASLLTLGRYWHVQGRPKPDVTPLGSFEAWTLIVGGILKCAGIEGFMGNAEETWAQADDESAQWELFLETLTTVFHGSPFKVVDICSLLKEREYAGGGEVSPTARATALRDTLPDILLEVVDKTSFFVRRLGKTFAERVHRRYGEGELYLSRFRMDHKVWEWEVRKGRAA